ncbi:MAG: type II toxin-antitoxin system RelE/ParE family toxin [Spirochaetaceae bacterium]|nr:MAG: type II toxin-antitoxin system RelE/ParE family toxin [Spirochaetaceae bacterium]
MATYRIEWKKSAIGELKHIDRAVIPRLITAVEALSDNPFPSGVTKLQGSKRSYRVRVNDYRIVYEVDHERVTIQILRVRHRRDVYKRPT